MKQTQSIEAALEALDAMADRLSDIDGMYSWDEERNTVKQVLVVYGRKDLTDEMIKVAFSEKYTKFQSGHSNCELFKAILAAPTTKEDLK